MPGAQKTKSGGARKFGRNATKCKRYAAGLRRWRNKIKRVRQSSGNAAAARHISGPRHAKRYLARVH